MAILFFLPNNFYSRTGGRGDDLVSLLATLTKSVLAVLIVGPARPTGLTKMASSGLV